MSNLEKLFEQGQLLRNNGEFDPAIRSYRQIISDEAADPQLAADSQHMIGVTYKQAEKFAAAENSLRIAQQLFAKQGVLDRVGMVLRDRGDIAFHQKKYDVAKSLFEKSITHLQAPDMIGHRGMTVVKLGEVIVAQGDFVNGEKTMIDGIALIEQSRDLFFLSNGYYHVGLVQKANGKKIEAKRSLEKSLEVLDSFSTEEEYKSRRQQIRRALAELAS